MLTAFVQEEFLRKLSKSGYEDNLILKGGLFIYTLTNFESRVTIDVDFLLRAASNSIEDVKVLIGKIINTPTGNDYISMTAKGFEEISPQRKYHGISAQIIAQIKNVRVPFNVDIGVGDVIVPCAEERAINTQLPDFEAPVIKTYSLESTIAEKFDAILQRFELTGRLKDFYDIYYLARTFDFDGAKLQTAIMRTLEMRGTPYDKDSFERIISLAEDVDMQKRWKHFLKNIKDDTLEFTVVIYEIRNFLEPVFENIITKKIQLKFGIAEKMNGDLVKKMSDLLYSTDYGKYYLGKCEETIKELDLKNKVQLILTSPPFPLNNKKQYGNLNGEEYLKWFTSLAELFSSVLTPNGSIVIEMGNAWEKNRPVQSLLHLNSLLSFVNNENAGLRLCQEFVCYNPARLPSPAQWVTINRIRTIDSFTHVWWMSNSDYPKADNRRVLRPYSKSMKKLLKSGKFNSGKRPSEHVISEKGFLTDNHGSISHNVLELEQIDEDKELRLPYSMFSISNTKSNDFFTKTCKERGIVPHPARMPLELASFFIEFLTDEGDLVLDPFGGSNTTGFCAEKLKRQWISIEANMDYGNQSTIRFEEPSLNSNVKMEEF